MGEFEKVCVHLAGHDYLTGRALHELLDVSGLIQVTGESATGQQALQQVRDEQPDIVILNAEIAGNGMAETIQDLLVVDANMKVVVLANDSSPEVMDAAHRTGAHGYFLRGAILEDLAAALRIIHRGGSIHPTSPASRDRGKYPSETDEAIRSRFKSFTGRDLQIIRGVTEGLTNTEIAGPLHLSEATVKARISRIKRHLGVTNRVQIAVQSARAGITSSPPEH
ncbi:DNA-binding NarL/FixJ family response regulator [Arthrobacter sp. CAN_A214]|uniref:LuxR C-terminal-related transcriptional regulator n=1 Tax=Arthrobacter sp. CAN_A214 TaxID=2787720 RepID=UPI0018CB9975